MKISKKLLLVAEAAHEMVNNEGVGGLFSRAFYEVERELRPLSWVYFTDLGFLDYGSNCEEGYSFNVEYKLLALCMAATIAESEGL